MIQDKNKLERPSFIDIKYSSNSNSSRSLVAHGHSINTVQEQQVPSKFQDKINDYALPSIIHPYANHLPATPDLLLAHTTTSLQTNIVPPVIVYGLALDGSSAQTQSSMSGRA